MNFTDDEKWAREYLEEEERTANLATRLKALPNIRNAKSRGYGELFVSRLHKNVVPTALPTLTSQDKIDFLTRQGVKVRKDIRDFVKWGVYVEAHQKELNDLYKKHLKPRGGTRRRRRICRTRRTRR